MTDHHDEHGDGHDDHGGMGKYAVVFIALLVLTALSYGAGTYFSGPNVTDPTTKSVGWAFMMAVSCAKAGLVMAIFMHLLWEANWKYVLTIPCIVMSTLLLLALTPDIGWRADNYTEERIRHAPELSAYGSHGHAEHSEGEDHSEGEHADGESEHDDDGAEPKESHDDGSN